MWGGYGAVLVTKKKFPCSVCGRVSTRLIDGIVWLCFDCSKNTETQGRKDDSGKLRWMLLPFKALREVVEVLEFGAKKYGVGNWEKVPDFKSRYADALMRHFTSWLDGEKTDSDTGKSHLAHAMCCALFLLHFELKEDK